MLAGICPQGIHIADVPLTLPEVKAADTIGNPKIEEDTMMTAGQKVTWDCIYFGSYPQSEITSKDGSVYNKLKNATSWDNNDTTIDGVKYRRLKGEDATQHAYSGGSEQYYDWNDDYTTYHYFKYEPIKWRVLNKDNNDVFLLSDIALDDQRYNEKWATITWEKSSMRSWINGYKASENQPEIDYSNKNFIDTAFSTAQKNAIKTTKVENRNNIHYGSAGQGGNDTSDKIFLLSEREVYNTDDAKKYGFVLDGEVYDEARRCKCSTYAYAMGTWRNIEDSECNGNALWFLRSPGGSCYGDVTAVYDFGRVNSGGTSIFSDHSVRPAIHLDLSSIDTANIYAGTVCSAGTVNEGKKEDTDNIASPLQKSGEFKFETSLHKIVNTSGGDKKTAKYIYDYDENWFFTPSTTYQHGLTKMSIRGAVAGYGVMDDPYSIDTNIKYLMAETDKNSLEFTNYESSYPDPKTNTIGYAISSKNIKNSAGKTGSLLMVTVRGGGYMGYSRGAATTNRVAKMLDDGAVEGLTRDNIYAFCFECPQNTTKTQSYVESDKYKNIVSIVNSVDLVPKVAMSGFEFKRYGTVYQLPNIRALADYGIARAKMVKCYTNLITYNKLALGARMYDWTEKEVKNLYLPMQAVVYLTKEGLAQASMMDKLMDDLCDVAVNRENYYMRLQANMISGMAGVLGKNSGLDTGALAVTIARVIPGLAAKHPLDNAYLLTHLIPLDENGQKIVCIPEDADYKVDLKATDNGTMTYTVMNQNLETNECSQVKSYVDIPIKEGEVYKSTFETDTESSTETLKNVSGDEVQPSIEKGASEDIKKQVNVTAQSGGSVTGGGSYTISEYAKVTAEPETNYTFAGWYENDNLISKEKEYRFCVQNNRNLSAHFSKNANQGTQKPSSNTTKPSGNTTKAPSIKPFKATGKPKQIAAGKKVNLKAEIGLPDRITKQLTWKSSNTKVATVNADGVVTVKKKTGGKKVTITASNDKIKVSASWKVTSMKGIVKKVKITGTKTVKAGKSLKLKANVTATKKANKKLQWTSSNAKYATVNAKGVVKTKKVAKGKTIKITAMATDGSNKKATFKVKVK